MGDPCGRSAHNNSSFRIAKRKTGTCLPVGMMLWRSCPTGPNVFDLLQCFGLRDTPSPTAGGSSVKCQPKSVIRRDRYSAISLRNPSRSIYDGLGGKGLGGSTSCPFSGKSVRIDRPAIKVGGRAGLRSARNICLPATKASDQVPHTKGGP
jgi:hypothetical protein